MAAPHPSDAAVDAAWAVLLRSSLFFGKDELRSALTAALSHIQQEKEESVTEDEVERVAKAMALESGDPWDAKHAGETLSGDAPEEMREYWRALSRIAIATMHRPPRCLSCGMKMDYTEAVNDWKAKHGG